MKTLIYITIAFSVIFVKAEDEAPSTEPDAAATDAPEAAPPATEPDTAATAEEAVEEKDEKIEEEKDEEKKEEGSIATEAKLTLGPEVSMPKNVVTDHYGNPIMTTDIMNFTLPNGGGMMKVYSELWKTYYTKPATKPGCLCVTRAPLPKLKLIGNIHFKKIKVVPPNYVTVQTEATSTMCPPCICPRCDEL